MFGFDQKDVERFLNALDGKEQPMAYELEKMVQHESEGVFQCIKMVSSILDFQEKNITDLKNQIKASQDCFKSLQEKLDSQYQVISQQTQAIQRLDLELQQLKLSQVSIGPHHVKND